MQIVGAIMVRYTIVFHCIQTTKARTIKSNAEQVRTIESNAEQVRTIESNAEQVRTIEPDCFGWFMFVVTYSAGVQSFHGRRVYP